jgi:hypothetical protein
MPMTREEGVAKMTARCRQIPLRALGEALEVLNGKRGLDGADRLTRSVFINVICERCPAAETAFQAWADSDNLDPKAPVAAIVAAAKEAGK